MTWEISTDFPFLGWKLNMPKPTCSAYGDTQKGFGGVMESTNNRTANRALMKRHEMNVERADRRMGKRRGGNGDTAGGGDASSHGSFCCVRTERSLVEGSVQWLCENDTDTCQIRLLFPAAHSQGRDATLPNWDPPVSSARSSGALRAGRLGSSVSHNNRFIHAYAAKWYSGYNQGDEKRV